MRNWKTLPIFLVGESESVSVAEKLQHYMTKSFTTPRAR